MVTGSKESPLMFLLMVEKLDAEGNNEDDGYTGGFGGFILHTGDNDERRFMWTVIKVGDTPSYTNPD